MVADSASPSQHVSVVICTRNRDDKIGSSVACVLENDYPSFDLTIIDQSTNDLTEAAIREAAGDDPRMTYVHSTEPGLSRAYNNGIRRTTGEIVAFTDDDCLAPTDWIAKIVAAFDSEPDGDLLYGNVVAAGSSISDRQLTPTLKFGAPRRLSKEDGFEVYGMGANFAARRRLFENVGVFDEVLGGGGALWSSQDFDLTYRTYHAGSVTLLRPEVVIRHDGRREDEDWPALLLAYGSGDGAFYTKHMRCRDLFAIRLFAVKVVRSLGRIGFDLVTKRKASGWPYVKGLARGARASFRFGIDRPGRVYLES